MPYAKLHSSIITSSIWTEPDPTRILFITLLALSDWNGNVYGSKKGISQVAKISPDAAEKAWTCLLSPDPDSSDLLRSPEHEGRRVEQIEQGFRIINYEYYRSIGSAEDRRTQNREAKRRERSCQHMSANVSNGHPPSAMSAHTDTDTDTDHKDVGANGSHPAPKVCDEEWLKALGTDPTYLGVNIQTEYGKMVRWCEVNRKKPSRRRFVNWINRSERPMKVEGLTPTTEGNGISSAQLTMYNQELIRVMEAIKEVKGQASQDAFGTKIYSEEDRKKLNSLVLRRNDLRAILGVTV